jgi:hypothetical protein
MPVEAKIQTTMKFQERDLLAIMTAILASGGAFPEIDGALDRALDRARAILAKINAVPQP